jgi:hypothetical protein
LVLLSYLVDFCVGVILSEINDIQIGMVFLQECEQFEIALDDGMLGAIDEILFRRVVEVFELVLTAELAGQ